MIRLTSGILLATLYLVLFSTFARASTQVIIQMSQEGFEPDKITIPQNSTVKFINTDKVARWPASNIHPTHEVYPQFDPKEPIQPGDSWTFKFRRSGTFKYHDHLLPHQRGEIIVTPASSESSVKTRLQKLLKPFRPLINKFFPNLFSMSAKQDMPGYQDRVGQANSILDEGTFRLLQKDEDPNAYISSQMSICYKSGGKNSCYKKVATILFSQFNLSKILDLIKDNEKVTEVFSRCHELTHYLSRMEYDKVKDISSVYNQCTSVCHGGCYHGPIEVYLKEKTLQVGPEFESQAGLEIPRICGKAEDYQVPLLYTECLHGIGHATMFVTDGDLIVALRLCDKLPDLPQQEACYSGAFMENSSSSTNLDHPSKYIKADDPMYPCNTLEERYLSLCYRYQSSHFALLTKSNWDQTANLCLQVPKPYQIACFLTIGSNQVGFTQDMAKMIYNCNLMPAPEYQQACFQGAVDALTIRYRGDVSRMIWFCSNTPPSHQQSCFSQMGLSLSSWSSKRADAHKLCDGISNPLFISWCKQTL